MHAGIGFHQTKALLVTLNIPGICKKTLKKREREVGQSVEKIADKLCNEALEMEASLMDKYVFSPCTSSLKQVGRTFNVFNLLSTF